MSSEPLQRREFEAQWLMDVYPPRWRHANKQLVFDLTSPPGSTFAGQLHYARWAAQELPDVVDLGAALDLIVDRAGFYDYEPSPGGDDAAHWHVNFADPNLFGAYGSGLFAQDEMQVTEHPALAALREAVTAAGLPAATVAGDSPTPVTVRGVERRCHVDTEPNEAEGRPLGLYGNAFGRADAEAVTRATRRRDPPTISNIIAMAAPPPSFGTYTAQQIDYVLVTAASGFGGAALESRGGDQEASVVVHTGFWGCGAFGGNRVLMTTLQTIAASSAGVERIVFHTGDASGAAAVEDSRRVLGDLSGDGPIAVREVVSRLAAMEFDWGESDGN